MQFVFLIVALTTLAIVFANASDVDVQAKKVKKAAGGSKFLNVMVYSQADVNCTGPVGYSSAVANDACWLICPRRRNLAEKGRKSKAMEAIAGIFKGKKLATSGEKLQDGPWGSDRTSFSGVSIEGLSIGEITFAGFAQENCTEFEAMPADNLFNIGSQYIALDTCFSFEGPPLNYKAVFSSEPLVPASPNGVVVMSGFKATQEFNNATCAMSPYGTSKGNDVNFYDYAPIGVCNLGGLIKVNGTEIAYVQYDNDDCTGDIVDVSTETTGVCDVGYSSSITGGGCVVSRYDVLLPGTPKNPKKVKSATATSLRI